MKFTAETIHLKPSTQIAAIRRKIRRLEEHRPLMMERIQLMNEADREVTVQWLDETLARTKAALEKLQQELKNKGGPQ